VCVQILLPFLNATRQSVSFRQITFCDGRWNLCTTNRPTICLWF
jgi:hypothetical protein